MIFYNKLSPTATFTFNGNRYSAINYEVHTEDKELIKFLDENKLWFKKGEENGISKKESERKQQKEDERKRQEHEGTVRQFMSDNTEKKESSKISFKNIFGK